MLQGSGASFKNTGAFGNNRPWYWYYSDGGDRWVMPRPEGGRTRVKRLEMRLKHPLAIRWCHWVNSPLLALMIWSGLWIYWADDVYRVGLGSFTLFKLFPEGFYRTVGLDHRLAEGMAWHFFFMWFFAINGLLYVTYTVFSGQWRYLVPNRQSFREAISVALRDLHLWKGQLPERKFNGAQQIAYTSVILIGFGSLVTGLAIYKLV